jgi:methionyl-tRNA formyltransferase
MKIGIILTPDERSKAYLSKIISNKINLDKIIFMNDNSNKEFSEQISRISKNYGFEISKSVKEILIENELDFNEFNFIDINSKKLIDFLKTLELDYIIFTGGGILRSEILNINSKFVHFHPGITPFYKGSTCFYYSILNENKCGVTAFIMDEKLDTGEIICQKEFSKPNHEFIDDVYDPHIRSELLIELFKKRFLENHFEENKLNEGETFYVIHPILKHIAIQNCIKKY